MARIIDRTIVGIALFGSAFASCNQATRQTGGSGKPTTKTQPTTEVVTVDSLTFGSVSSTTIYTSDAGTNNCVSFKVTALSSSKAAVPNASIAVSLAGVEASATSTWGQLSTPITTGTDGVASGTFCAATTTGSVTFVAESGSAKANSAVVTITTKPSFTFSYRNSDFDSNSPKPTETLNLNLLDSGPNDCGNIYFQLTKLKDPVSGVSLKFKSDFGYPAGAKLRARTSSDTPYETDTTTQKTFLSYTATSDTDGLFKIPVCSGQLPGSLIVYAYYTDEYGKTSYAKSPTISISSGIANLTSLALNFDKTNARTLKALFNNEAPTPIDFVAKISSVFGGALSVLNPVYIQSESGTLDVDNGGVPDDSGSVKFSMLASYNGTARPTPVRLFNSSAAQSTCDPEAIAKELEVVHTAGNFEVGKKYEILSQGSTDFTSLGASSNSAGTVFTANGAGTGTGTARLYEAFSYQELAKNWRSTLVYLMRGQEPFNDANRNGKYDTGGDGFWDKNQDGAYTQGVDAVTYFGSVAGGAQCRCLTASGVPAASAPTQGAQTAPCIEDPSKASCFRRNSEWFIDLPTPFVDANENGIYETTVSGQDMDRLIGDVYSEPNSKRDVDTLIWKSFVLPIYTGTSLYAMVRGAIKSGSTITPHYDPDPIETDPPSAYFLDLANRNLTVYGSTYISKLFHAQTDLDTTTMFGDGASGYRGYRWVAAHGICGTPVPGGTKIETKDELISEPFGSRTVTFNYYMQPGDQILDPSRRLLADGNGGSSATINFNIPDHPAAAFGYPVEYRVEVAKCTRAVPNGTGIWCSAATHKIHTTLDTDTVTAILSIPEYKAGVSCNAGYHQNTATGSCDSDT